MEELSALLHGFSVVLTPFNFLLMFVGITLGVIIGVLPGLGGANGIAILLPLTFSMSPTSAIIMLSCIYWGALFGGAITSILFNIPGEPWSVATTFDGYPMAQQGRAGEALTGAFTSSFVGALVAVLVFTFIAPAVAAFALEFGPAEFFSVYLLTFCSFVGTGKGNPFKIIASMMLGFAMAAVGIDIVTGELRLTFGFMQLLQGFGVDAVVVQRFDLEFARREAKDFVCDLLVKKLGAKKIWAGRDLRFGRGRKGCVEDLILWGRDLGFEVYEGELHDAAFPSQYFDVVTAAELLEHLIDPKPLLQEVARILRPGGLFWTTTPNARGLSGRLLGLKWRCVWPPEHLQLFSIRGIEKLLRAAGFRDLRIDTTGGNPIMALRATTTAPRPGNRHTATAAPRGKPTIEASATAAKLTIRDRRMMATSSRSRCIIKAMAVSKAVLKSCMPCLLSRGGQALHRRAPAWRVGDKRHSRQYPQLLCHYYACFARHSLKM